MKQIICSALLTFIFVNLFLDPVDAQSRAENLNRFFQVLSDNQDFNGNILVAENGKVIYERSFGLADIPGKEPNRKDTVFPIASITKTLTATAILQQVERGKIKLDASAAKYLPDFPFPEITIRHLLSHTSGLPPYSAFFSPVAEKNPEIVFHNSDFIAGLNAHRAPLIYRPGDNWNYDNINFIVLSLILEKVSGEPYVQYIQNRILGPAGMKHTVFFPNQVAFDAAKNKGRKVVVPHLYTSTFADKPVRADSISYISDYWKTYQFSGFGDFASTTHDLLKYDEALYDGRLLGPRLLNEAYTPVTLNSGKVNFGNYGLGWTVAPASSFGKTVFHAGAAIGLSCVIYRNITRHQTVVVYDIAYLNSANLAAKAMKILNGQNVDLPKKKLARVYGKILVTRGKDAANEQLATLIKDTANYELDKDELIKLGYELLGDVNPYHVPMKIDNAAAIEVFKEAVKCFPDYWNSYDSYGDALARTGDTEGAIKMYRKSIELNAENEGGKKALEKLLRSGK